MWLMTIRRWLERVPLSMIQLMMRVAVGSVFLKAGLLKYHSWEFTVKLFEDEYKVPFVAPTVAARMAMFTELTCSTLLILGLATRVATLPLLGMIAVIQLFVYPQAWTDNLLWASILVFLLTRGPGALSLDNLIEKGASRASAAKPSDAPHSTNNRRGRTSLG